MREVVLEKQIFRYIFNMSPYISTPTKYNPKGYKFTNVLFLRLSRYMTLPHIKIISEYQDMRQMT